MILDFNAGNVFHSSVHCHDYIGRVQHRSSLIIEKGRGAHAKVTAAIALEGDDVAICKRISVFIYILVMIVDDTLGLMSGNKFQFLDSNQAG